MKNKLRNEPINLKYMAAKRKAKHVYVILNEDTNRIKIGITMDIKYRLSALSCSAGSKMSVVYLSNLFTNAEYIEKTVHIRLHHARYVGEWFDISKEIAIDITKMYCNTIGKIMPDRSAFPYNDIEKEKSRVVDMAISPEERCRSINFNTYKRLKPGVYQDYSGDIFSISYNKNGEWIKRRL